MKFETQCIHAGLDVENDTPAIVPPISPSTIYEIASDGDTDKGFLYSRLGNPNRLQLETLLAALERGKACAAFASGLAASAALLQALDPGDEVIFPDDIYSGNRNLINGILKRWGLRPVFVRMSESGEAKNAITPKTKLIWIESPSNPMLRITDIRSICNIAREKGIRTVVDNTWPTPVNQLPLELGADFVIHSTTKYFGGHSDLLGGAVIAAENDAFFERIRYNQQLGGGVPSAFDCWMLNRSIRTLPCRMGVHNTNAEKVAGFLVNHPKIEKVLWPGIESHEGHAIAKEQMCGFGGMISFLLKESGESTQKAVSRAKLIKHATSLGGVESTWERRRATEGEASETPENLIRLSVGLEHADDIIEDIEQCLR